MFSLKEKHFDTQDNPYLQSASARDLNKASVNDSLDFNSTREKAEMSEDRSTLKIL